MKSRLVSVPLVALLAAASFGVRAHEVSSEYGPYHWLEHVRQSSPSGPAQTAGDFDAGQYAEGASIYRLQSQASRPADLRGIVGPAAAEDAAAAERELERRLGGIGGRNTP